MVSGGKPNILILSAYDIGGASIAAIRLHLGLLEIGANSKLLTLNKSVNHIPEHYQFKPSSGWKSKIQLKLRQRNEHIQKSSLQLMGDGSLSGEYSMPIASYDVTESPLWEWADIVNLHWVNEWISFESLMVKSSKPMVWTMHDMHCFTGGCHYSHGCLGFQSECKDCPMLVNTNMPQMANYFWKSKMGSLSMLASNLTITAPSNWMANLAKSSALLKGFNSVGIPNGLDVKLFNKKSTQQCREILQLPESKFVLVSVIQSLRDRRKGFKILLDALAFLPNPDKFLLCTVGNLTEEIDSHGVSHFHLGTIADERLMAMVYNSADIFVHPATEDNFPNVVIEALSCGVPVTGFNIGGMAEMVIQEKNGLLSDDINPEKLAKNIVQLLDLKLDRAKISVDAHEKFDQKLQAKNFEELFKFILS